MQNKKSQLIAVILFMLLLSNLQAQEAIPASGGIATGSNGSISYSIGQVVFTTITGVNGIVPLGVQQPYEFLMRPGPGNVEKPITYCMVYPNPVTDFLTLKVENGINLSLSTFSFQLSDMGGKLIEKKKIIANETIIPMMNLVPSVYQLIVIENNNEIITFKIIKK